MSQITLYSFFHAETGLFAQQAFGTNDTTALALNTPPDHIALAGEYDRLCQRVDVEASEVLDEQGARVWPVVDYQPPAPEPDALRTWAWDTATRRWLPVPTLAALQAAATQLRTARLAELDAQAARPAQDIAEAQALGEEIDAADLAVLRQVNALKRLCRQQIAAIVAAQTEAELATIDPVP